MDFGSVINSAIEIFSPRLACKRAAYSARRQLIEATAGSMLGNGYPVPVTAPTPVGAKRGFRAWSVSAANADGELLPILDDTRARCRDLYRNNPLARGFVETKVTNVIGSGLQLHPRIDREALGMSEEQADAWEKQAYREWKFWSGSPFCDYTLHDNFSGLQRLLFLSALVAGEVLYTLPWKKRPGSPYDLRVQIIEADRLIQPYSQPTSARFAGGIELDDDGGPKYYHFAKEHPGQLFGLSVNQETERVPAFGKNTGRRNVIHFFKRERPEQRRGAPYLMPVIEPLKQLGRYTDAELMAAVVSAMFTVFIERSTPDEGDGFSDALPPSEQAVPYDPSSYELGAGAVVAMQTGEKVSIADPSRPITGFDAFWNSTVRLTAAGLNQSSEIVLKYFQSSYSASRAAMLEVWRAFFADRSWMSSGVCQPIYEEFLTEAVIKGRINAPGFLSDPFMRAAYCGSDWVGPAKGQIDELKEAQAAEVRVREGFSTREREAAEISGMGFEDINRQRAKEESMRREGCWSPENSLSAEVIEIDETDTEQAGNDD